MNTILIIDDNELVNKLLAETLMSHGFDVSQARDANEGYQQVQRKMPDLILLDIVLPDVNGVQLCKAFRSHPQTRHVPIILITGTASSTLEKVQGLQAGADDYILKPFEMDELLERVRAVLRRAQSSTTQPVTPPTPQENESSLLSPQKSGPLLSTWGALHYVTTLVTLLAIALAMAPGAAIPPILACFLAVAFWVFLVSVLTVSASISGVHLKWKEAASLFSFAALPLLLKFAGACLFSAWTTLSPFLFTAGPGLVIAKSSYVLDRLDFFEIWTVGLLSVLLQKRPGATRTKSWVISVIVWGIALLTAFGLLQVGKPS